jgi:hypothetical protein
MLHTQASSGLSEALPKNGDVPKSPLLLIGSPGAIGRHTILQLVLRSGAGCHKRPVPHVPARFLLSKGEVMELPEFLEGKSLTRLLQGAAAGAVATMIVGFNWGGWMLSRDIDKIVTEKVAAASIVFLGERCADKFNAQSDALEKKAVLRATESDYEKGKLLPKEWVTLDGGYYPNSDLVTLCSNLILNPQSAELK